MTARCTYMSETVMVFLDGTTRFSDFFNEICMRFKGLKPGLFELKYSLPDYPSCALDSDLDMRLMFRSLAEFKRTSVDILVRICDFGANCVADGVQCSAAAAASSCVSVVSTVIEEPDYLGDFRPEDPKVYMSKQWREYIKCGDQKFRGGAVEFRQKLCMYAIEVGFVFVYVRNDKWRVIAECFNKLSEGCKWYINASLCPANNFFYIRQLNNVHTCSGVLRQQKHKLLSSTIVKTLINDEFRGNPSLKAHDIMDRLKNNYGLDITYRVAWKGKEKAMKELHGSDEDSYSMLTWYRDAVMESNPGSCFILECDESTGRFQRLFLCFGGVIEGFKSCIPLLFVDGAHLKSKYKGQLLSATGKDGNQGFFPFAIAVVDAETDANWNWYFGILKTILDPQGRVITFVSDRQQGLMNSLARVFPESPHSFCLYHLKNNLQNLFKGNNNSALRVTIVDKFYKVAYSSTERQYHYNLRELLDEGKDLVAQFLRGLPVEKWCNAFFRGNRFGEMVNSTAESFNSWTLKARELPIFPMLEKIRVMMMAKMVERKLLVSKWSLPLCPVMQAELVKNMEIGRDWTVSRSDEFVYEVHSERSTSVDIMVQTCACRQWQIKSFPCSHALAAIQRAGYVVYPFIERYYFKEEYFKSYSFGIKPIPNIEQSYVQCSDSTSVKPPLTRRPPGRPKTKRIKSVGEVSSKERTCGRCGQLGRHNRKTCNVPI
ncbi:uncharacterized protein LOC112184036 [Rosa chinensis]|uniref:uncharacterized protein LOC112184036 n=1 Tax=Rosa chinensis TaxID=74649 RepID=UPI001AD8CAEF|nr:uncharacterized protein LOC112184036 [Rosa chinensis]